MIIFFMPFKVAECRPSANDDQFLGMEEGEGKKEQRSDKSKFSKVSFRIFRDLVMGEVKASTWVLTILYRKWRVEIACFTLLKKL